MMRRISESKLRGYLTPIFKTPWLPFGWDGMACRWFILLRRGHDDLIVHEEFHIKQQKQLGVLTYGWRYLTDKDFRFDVEYSAYIAGGLGVEDAYAIAKRYR
jgi:hypothetical protein